MSKRQQKTEFEKDRGGEITPDQDPPLPVTYVVMKIAPDIREQALQWIIGKVRGRKGDGGGGLIVVAQRRRHPEEEFTFHISATTDKLLETAEEIEVTKRDARGREREFTVAHLQDFLSNGQTVDDLLTLSERQIVVAHALENIRASADDEHVPGYPLRKLYEGQAIVPALRKWRLVTKTFPLHDEEQLKKLAGSWYMSWFNKQPVDDIKRYFGESIALYFAFLEYYTLALTVPAVLGLLGCVFAETVPFFCAFNVVWATLFLETWRRKSNGLAFKWGTIGMTGMDEPRPGFRGTLGVDSVSGKVLPQSPRFVTYVKMYAVSMPVVIACTVLAFYLMLLSFWTERYIQNLDGLRQYYAALPSIVYSILVLIMGAHFRNLATLLTEWENHRTRSQFERHRVTKLVLFEFVNNFLSLFYVAFVVGDLEALRSQLRTMLIVSQAVNNFQEVFLPVAMNYYNAMPFARQKLHPVGSRGNPADRQLNIPQVALDDPRTEQARREGDMEEYQDTFDDYLELFVQFGYVFLFSSVYPVAAFWALLNNVLELRADAFKLCRLYRRPFARKAKDIGAWQRSFEILGGLSILTNCGVLYLSPDVRKRAAPASSDAEWLVAFLCLEQLLLGVRYLLHVCISDKPEWVRVALARRNREAKRALKFERSRKDSATGRKIGDVRDDGGYIWRRAAHSS